MKRIPEPELMDLPDEVSAYARADFAEVNQKFVDRLLELENSTKQLRAVDLGCGPGDIAIRLARARPEWRIVAVDASSPMLDEAKRALVKAGMPGCVEFMIANVKRTGLPHRAFDVVMSNSVVHHLNEPLEFWREIGRIIRPGGSVLVRDLARPGDEDHARQIVDEHARVESELLREEYYRSLLSAYTVNEVREQLQQAGLQSLSVGMSSDRHLDVWGKLP